MSNFNHTKSVAEVHRLFGLGKPHHPLISVSWHQPVNYSFGEMRATSDLYLITLKGNTSGTFAYGRNSYDFEEGTMVFIAPMQVTSFGESGLSLDNSGWSVLFHPDLVRQSRLNNLLQDYSFFQYKVNEALHLSDKEKATLTELVQQMDTEIHQNTDKHSQALILVLLETILTYCRRFYDRQFYTRTNFNSDLITRFEAYLADYFTSDTPLTNGLPSVTQCGAALNLSGSYLSDLLRIETGKSTLAHIHEQVIERGKTLLLHSNNTVSQVAYQLGFKSPQHFSKLFKIQTGISPTEYRNLH
jgi:AraC-like DNA-binding protein